jgi:DNA-nicking Smr family endonuclease
VIGGGDDEDGHDGPNEDVEAFRDAVRGAEPIPDDGRAELPRERPRPTARFKRAADREVMFEAMHRGDAAADLSSGEELSFRRDHLGLKAFRRLRRGGFPIHSEIDLHGLTLAQSREELSAFLARTRSLETFCIRIVTGRGLRSSEGRPVLRPAVARWLRNDPRVLAYTSARQVDGGLGAIYVLMDGRR